MLNKRLKVAKIKYENSIVAIYDSKKLWQYIMKKTE